MFLLTIALYPLTALVLLQALGFHAAHSVGSSTFAATGVVLPALFLPVMKNAIQLMLAGWYGVLNRRPAPSRTLPSVSVLNPAWNEEVGIVAAVRSVVATKYRAWAGSTYDTNHAWITSAYLSWSGSVRGGLSRTSPKRHD